MFKDNLFVGWGSYEIWLGSRLYFFSFFFFFFFTSLSSILGWMLWGYQSIWLLFYSLFRLAQNSVHLFSVIAEWLKGIRKSECDEVFDWAMLFSCPVFRKMLKWRNSNILQNTGQEKNIPHPKQINCLAFQFIFHHFWPFNCCFNVVL